MKSKQKLFSAFTVMMLFGLIAVAVFALPHKPPAPGNVPTTETEQPPTFSADYSSEQTSAPTRSSNSQAPKHHASPTLEAHQNTPQVPYYLLIATNDPMLSSSWAHTKVQTNRSWDLTIGSTATTVAVIDTGFELDHEDLAGRWYENTGETGMTIIGGTCWTGSPTDKSSNNCDDDQNGYIDDWRGYDFFYEDNNPQAGQVSPSGEGTQHGTMVAGMVGATANNAKGSAGIDQKTKIMPLQVFSDDGEAYTSDVVAAIDYATDMNADVINLSLGTNQYDAALLSAITRARTNGTLVIAASGNCALNDEEFCNNLSAPGRMTYPALYQSVIAVGATTSSDQRASYSSYGPELDIVAPGSSVGPLPIYNGGQLNSYATASGTSFAAPLVAGLASLLIGQNPSINLTQIENLLIGSTDRISGMNNQVFTNEYGYGRINAHKATLLGLAKTQENLLGSALTSPRQSAVGRVWRATTGSVKNDEFVLIGCRVLETDVCSATVENGTIYRFNTVTQQKGDAIQYIFINGSSLPSGNLKLSVHNHEYATSVTTLAK